MVNSSSELSSALSSPPDSDIDHPMPDLGLDGAADRRSSPSISSVASKKRSSSPMHEPSLADNPDIAFIVMFRSRFNEAFSTKLAHFGPQDIEFGVASQVPSPQVEALLCALLGLVMNRKKPIERGHYGRALEEALHTHKSEWPRAWGGMNPLSGNRSFGSMGPEEKLTLLKTLILWALHSSDVISGIMKEKFKQSRQEGDQNQPLSIQPWGTDSSRRAYWLVEGQGDTSFRVYRERKSRDAKKAQWISVAGSIDELKVLAAKLEKDGAQASRRLAGQITNAIPRFEATDEKRRRREYRVSRKTQFSRPEPGFSLYEGRTRGKRARYTFDDEDDYGEETSSDVVSNNRRSARNSGAITPARPTVTASGRQVRSRMGGSYGDALTVGGADLSTRQTAMGDGYQSVVESDAPVETTATGRKKSKPGWKGWAMVADDGPRDHIAGYNEVDAMEEDEEEALSSGESGNDWDDGEDDDDDIIRARDADDEDDGESEESNIDTERKSLVVTLRYSNKVAETTTGASKTTDGVVPKQVQRSVPSQPTAPSKAASAPTRRSPLASRISVPEVCEVTAPASAASTLLYTTNKLEQAPFNNANPTPPSTRSESRTAKGGTTLKASEAAFIANGEVAWAPAAAPAVQIATATTTNAASAQWKQGTLDSMFAPKVQAAGSPEVDGP